MSVWEYATFVWVPQGPEEGKKSSGAGVAGDCNILGYDAET